MASRASNEALASNQIYTKSPALLRCRLAGHDMCSRSSPGFRACGIVETNASFAAAVTVCGDCRDEFDDLRAVDPSPHGGSRPGERSFMSSVETWCWILLLVLALPVIATAGALLVRRAVGPDVL